MADKRNIHVVVSAIADELENTDASSAKCIGDVLDELHEIGCQDDMHGNDLKELLIKDMEELAKWAYHVRDRIIKEAE